ncbi:hypothetical protein HGM15179_006540 [Zosterops borbonicus]|uniref:Cystin-1 n=1 Tax=Zosterops borbonicus TaxID=364589 RepID=A0A8K1GMB8_9PASS|nr:hypothetical protein HGM15179_006540 [Zosterops borbonicus]
MAHLCPGAALYLQEHGRNRTERAILPHGHPRAGLLSKGLPDPSARAVLKCSTQGCWSSAGLPEMTVSSSSQLREMYALSTRSPPGPENNHLDHQCPESSKKSLGQSTILYDYSEEELMASIEREYCR